MAELKDSLELSPRDKLINSIFIKAGRNFFLGITAIILALALVVKFFEKDPVYYIPGVGEEGFAQRDKIPLTAVANMGKMFLMKYHSWGPKNVRGVMESVLPLFSSKVIARQEDRMRKQIKDITNNNWEKSIVLVGEEEIIKIEGQDGVYALLIKANIRMWARGKSISNRYEMFEVVMEEDVPTPENPYGIYVYSEESEDYGIYKARMEGTGAVNEEVDEERLKENLDNLDAQ